MGKIGDLFVRLGLKSDDYKKGMAEAKKETRGFGATLGKMKAGALAVWAAIGTAVIKFGKDFINSTNKIGDTWARMTAQMKAGWNMFLRSLSSNNWENFFIRMGAATRAAKDLANALDAQFEGKNSIQLQRAAMAEELAELEIIARDQTKTYKERAKAAQDYLDKVKPIYQQQIDLANDLKDAQFGNWLAGTGIQDNAQARKDLERFLVDYGNKKTGLAGIAADYLAALNALRKVPATKMQYDAESDSFKRVSNTDAVAKAQAEVNRIAAELSKYGKKNGYSVFVGKLAEIYENWKNDADTQPLVDAIIAAYEAEAAFNRETKRMQGVLNTNIAADTNAQLSAVKEQVKEIERLANEDLKLDLEIGLDTEELDFSELDAEIEDFANSWNQHCLEIKEINDMLRNSLVDAFSSGVQALTDFIMGVDSASVEQVMAAFIQPIADTMKQMGELFMAEGVAELALVTGTPSQKIAAGAALIAIGAAISSGLAAMTGAVGGGGTAATTSSQGTSSSGSLQTYEQEITVNVVGEISGDKIVLAGQKTLNKWSR